MAQAGRELASLLQVFNPFHSAGDQHPTSSSSAAKMIHNVPSLKDESLFKTQAYINGQWVNSRSGQTFEVQDPATGKLIGTMPEMANDDVDHAIDCAQKAFLTFRKTTNRERSKMLRKWYDLIMANEDDLATLITWENGKPYYEAKDEVKYAADFVEWFSEEAPRIYGETIPASVDGRRVYTMKEPVGVCGLVTPWNW
jgi:succinate-semialdehyde dehydrogenase / glutarate-semialdehyde dehydrogenase